VIDRREISALARELSLDLHVVEKDYVLGWLLAGIAANPEISKTWVFKGGTCLKKCYFETYRFSEDLDFTVTEETHIDKASQDEPIYFRTSAQPGTPRPRNLRVGSVKSVGDLTSHGIPEWGLRESALRNFARNQITVANRRIEMREYQDALCRMRLGHTDRAISRDRVLGRRKLGELRAVAGDRG
jgi:hypothetical protein